MQGTLDSINTILKLGRIGDVYSLLRKLHDYAVLNAYVIAKVKSEKSLENIFVEDIRKWIVGRHKMPSYKLMQDYLGRMAELDPVFALLQSDDRYAKLRERSNDHMHLNAYKNVLLNDGDIAIAGRIQELDNLRDDLEDVFVLHFSCLFTLHPHYMMATDYGDALDLGLEPADGSESLVAPFIQEAFDSIIKNRRPDIAMQIQIGTSMRLS